MAADRSSTAIQEAGSKAQVADNTAERAGCIHRQVEPVTGADSIQHLEGC